MTRSEGEARVVEWLHERGSLLERGSGGEALLNYRTPTVRTMILVMEALGVIRFDDSVVVVDPGDAGERS